MQIVIYQWRIYVFFLLYLLSWLQIYMQVSLFARQMMIQPRRFPALERGDLRKCLVCCSTQSRSSLSYNTEDAHINVETSKNNTMQLSSQRRDANRWINVATLLHCSLIFMFSVKEAVHSEAVGETGTARRREVGPQSGRIKRVMTPWPHVLKLPSEKGFVISSLNETWWNRKTVITKKADEDWYVWKLCVTNLNMQNTVSVTVCMIMSTWGQYYAT